MARPPGLEPGTYGFVDRHSIQLSYGRARLSLAGQNGEAYPVAGSRSRQKTPGIEPPPGWALTVALVDLGLR